MWAKSDKRQVCAFCSIGTNHTTYPSCTQYNCSDFGSTASLFLAKFWSISLSFFISTKSTHFALIVFYLMLSHSPFVCYPLLAQVVSETSCFYFRFPILYVNFSLSNVQRNLRALCPCLIIIFCICPFSNRPSFTPELFFSGLMGFYPLVLEAMIWTQWPWRDKPISWLISSVCFS